MQEKKKSAKEARGLYIVLAIMIVTIMLISVVTMINKRDRGNRPPVDTGEMTTNEPETTKPIVTSPPPTESDDPGETQEPTDTSDAPPESTEPSDNQDPGEEKPVISTRIYMMPVRGNIIKACSGDLPVYSLTMNDYRVHSGVDIGASVGTPVYAFTDGTIKEIYSDPMMGMTLVIDHGEGLVSKYQNLQTEFPQGIEAGKKVSAGDIIAGVGETTLIELAENTHLHFEILKDDKNVDPMKYIEEMNASDLPDENYEY